jgi:hypothetical protein
MKKQLNDRKNTWTSKFIMTTIIQMVLASALTLFLLLAQLGPGSVGDMFDKDKAEKSHYHYRYVCCIGSRSTLEIFALSLEVLSKTGYSRVQHI